MALRKSRGSLVKRLAGMELKLLPRQSKPKGAFFYPETIALLEYYAGIAALKRTKIDTKRNRGLVKRGAILAGEFAVSKDPAIWQEMKRMLASLALQAYQKNRNARFGTALRNEMQRLTQQLRQEITEKVRSN